MLMEQLNFSYYWKIMLISCNDFHITSRRRTWSFREIVTSTSHSLCNNELLVIDIREGTNEYTRRKDMDKDVWWI